ncbi:unnamed protein product [Caenorhabditis auriculariae]|uniref:Cytoplasmic polyadenylation element-binding protein 1 n=1 Tax=Caenorhabditis auriculariae TaxID=2777116 RepID=A0A8S1HM40_9PELO|nr:unnamed protein product [Caenorhabditis auriculariae]
MPHLSGSASKLLMQQMSTNPLMYHHYTSEPKSRLQLQENSSFTDAMRSMSLSEKYNCNNPKRATKARGQNYADAELERAFQLQKQVAHNDFSGQQSYINSSPMRFSKQPSHQNSQKYLLNSQLANYYRAEMSPNSVNFDPQMDLHSHASDEYVFGSSGSNRMVGGGEYGRMSLVEGPKMMMSVQDVHSSRSVGGPVTRKNRMVEMTSIDEENGSSPLAMVVLSDPSSGHNSRSTRIVKIPTRPGAPKNSNPLSNAVEPLFSRKVFVGGLPIDVTEEEVWATFAAFGKVLVDWPRRPEHGRGDFFEDAPRKGSRSVSGYVFLVFDQEESVQRLVSHCVEQDNRYYLFVSSPTMSDKPVQVRPWRLSDIDYFADKDAFIDPRRTVFIGGVPRPTKARDLAECLQRYYGQVSYVGIDIDPELKYPKGAARVTFASSTSFVAAITGRFVHVNHSETNKRVEIKPYVMEEQICDECEGQLCRFNYAPYFCGDPSCLQFYCETCWDRVHYVCSENRSQHRPMVRTGDQTRVLPRPPHHGSNGLQVQRRAPNFVLNLSNSMRLSNAGSRLSSQNLSSSVYGSTLTY